MTPRSARVESDKNAVAARAAASFTWIGDIVTGLFWGFRGSRFTSYPHAVAYARELVSSLEAEGRLERQKNESPYADTFHLVRS